MFLKLSAWFSDFFVRCHGPAIKKGRQAPSLLLTSTRSRSYDPCPPPRWKNRKHHTGSLPRQSPDGPSHMPVPHSCSPCSDVPKRPFSAYRGERSSTACPHFRWTDGRGPLRSFVSGNRARGLSPTCGHHGWIPVKGRPVPGGYRLCTGQNAPYPWQPPPICHRSSLCMQRD